ncbi:MAG: DNA starvation/stationary phase protection protein [Myxococcales bacterium]|nr:DNA starvation/stationary phase protection protein [Myxococcales bacterium]
MLRPTRCDDAGREPAEEASEVENAPVVEALRRLLAETYTLYLKTHGHHWNVTGPMFHTLHTLFETEYTELALAVDRIAERIRAVGARAPASYSEFAELSTVREDVGPRTAREMLEGLAADQLRLVASARRVVEAAEAARDLATADLGVERIDVHEKNAWMLRSHLE